MIHTIQTDTERSVCPSIAASDAVHDMLIERDFRCLPILKDVFSQISISVLVMRVTLTTHNTFPIFILYDSVLPGCR